MIKQTFDVDGYWKVIVYYNLDYSLFSDVVDDLHVLGAKAADIWKLFKTMNSGKAKAVTYSNLNEHTSIVIFNNHDSKEDYMNSIIHEAEHVKQAMLKAYQVEDSGEEPAYTIGYLVSRMYEVFKELVCGR